MQISFYYFMIVTLIFLSGCAFLYFIFPKHKNKFRRTWAIVDFVWVSIATISVWAVYTEFRKREIEQIISEKRVSALENYEIAINKIDLIRGAQKRMDADYFGKIYSISNIYMSTAKLDELLIDFKFHVSSGEYRFENKELRDKCIKYLEMEKKKALDPSVYLDFMLKPLVTVDLFDKESIVSQDKYIILKGQFVVNAGRSAAITNAQAGFQDVATVRSGYASFCENVGKISESNDDIKRQSEVGEELDGFNFSKKGYWPYLLMLAVILRLCKSLGDIITSMEKASTTGASRGASVPTEDARS